MARIPIRVVVVSSKPRQPIRQAVRFLVHEERQDKLVEESPANVLRLWLDDKDERDLVLHSANYVNRCLYSLHLKKFDSFIEVNPIWKKYLMFEQSNLLTFIRNSLVTFLKS